MEIAGSDVLRYHASMLTDAVRTESYRRAIHEIVETGDVVLDLGAGTGVLALFAAEAGAARTYAVEQGPAIELARLVRQANPLGERLELIHGASQAAALPERADVLVTETLWNFGLGEGMVGAVIDARERLLKPGARIVPERVDLVVAPVEKADVYRAVDLWSDEMHGIDFSAVRTHAVNNHLQVSLAPGDLLSPPATIARVSLETAERADIAGTAAVRLARDGTIHGIGGWFRAQLSPSIELTNAPPSRTPNWSHVLFPLERPIVGHEGQTLSIAMASTGNGGVWSWRVDLEDDLGTTLARGAQQSTLWGFPLGQERMRRRSGAHRPEPSERGSAVAKILALADGSRSIDEITAALLEDFPRLFRRERDAADLVRSVVADYC